MPGSELRGFNLKRNRKKRWVAPYGTFNPEFSPQGVRLTMQVMNSHDRIMQVDREPNRPRNLKFGLLQYRVGDRTLDPNAIMQPNHRTATRSCLEFPKEGHHELWTDQREVPLRRCLYQGFSECTKPFEVL